MLATGFEIIPLDKVYNNAYILVGSRYIDIKRTDTFHSLIALGDERYFSVCSGGTPSSTKPDYWNGDINWITLADLPAEKIVTEIKQSERKITKDGLDNSKAKLVPINTVVVSTRATIGRVGIARTELATNRGFKNITNKIAERIKKVLVN